MANPLVALQSQMPNIVGSYQAGQRGTEELQTARLGRIMEQMKLDAAQREQTQQNALQQFYQQNGPGLVQNDPTAIGGLAKINPGAALDFQTKGLAAQDAQRKRALDNAEFIGRAATGILSAPPDQQANLYGAAIMQAKGAGIDVSRAPAQWGPEASAFLANAQAMATSVKDQQAERDKGVPSGFEWAPGAPQSPQAPQGVSGDNTGFPAGTSSQVDAQGHTTWHVPTSTPPTNPGGLAPGFVRGPDGQITKNGKPPDGMTGGQDSQPYWLEQGSPAPGGMANAPIGGGGQQIVQPPTQTPQGRRLRPIAGGPQDPATIQAEAEARSGAAAPTTRNVIQGNNEVTQEWDPKTRTWHNLGAPGPRFGSQVAANAPALDINDPRVQNYTTAVRNGNATMAQVPAGAIRNGVAAALAGGGKEIFSPLAATRFSTAANRIVTNDIKLPQYQMVANGLPYLQRIDAAIANPGSIGDAELLDSLVKLNTGGNAITDAQVKLITDGRSFGDSVGVWMNRLKSGGVLSDAQRKEAVAVAKATFKKYQQGYQPVYDRATKKLRDAGIPEQFWSIPDLNNIASEAGFPLAGAAPPAGGHIPLANAPAYSGQHPLVNKWLNQ